MMISWTMLTTGFPRCWASNTTHITADEAISNDKHQGHAPNGGKHCIAPNTTWATYNPTNGNRPENGFGFSELILWQLKELDFEPDLC